MSLNGAKNNPEIVTKITAVRPKGEGPSHKPPPLNTPLQTGLVLRPTVSDHITDDFRIFRLFMRSLDE